MISEELWMVTHRCARDRPAVVERSDGLQIIRRIPGYVWNGHTDSGLKIRNVSTGKVRGWSDAFPARCAIDVQYPPDDFPMSTPDMVTTLTIDQYDAVIEAMDKIPPKLTRPSLLGLQMHLEHADPTAIAIVLAALMTEDRRCTKNAAAKIKAIDPGSPTKREQFIDKHGLGPEDFDEPYEHHPMPGYAPPARTETALELRNRCRAWIRDSPEGATIGDGAAAFGMTPSQFIAARDYVITKR